ncbi:HtaA domain-containing protein [Dietzia sp. 179-F 9C3 NHS]|uniref:HtaA domain-containing protein n=1 Tax=Dietzia sp. 179-F 9C3 NHS TaxID=3374295 RepID=UPI00387917FC
MSFSNSRSAAIALTSAALMGLSALAAPGIAGAAEVDCDPADLAYSVDSGAVKWGVKTSFRSYLKGPIAQGDWDLSDGVTFEGAERGADGQFVWPVAGDAATVSPTGATAAGTGAVLMRGHHDVLHTTISNPTVEINGTEGTLKMDYRAKKVASFVPDAPFEWVEGRQALAVSFTLPEAPSFQQAGTITVKTGATTIDEGFGEAFADMYDSEDDMDPLTLVLNVSATCDAGGGDDDDDNGDGGDNGDNGGDTDNGGDNGGDGELPGGIFGSLGVFGSLGTILGSLS